jgi:hypothetical protein
MWDRGIYIWIHLHGPRKYGEAYIVVTTMTADSVQILLIIIIIFHSVCNLNGYDSHNITITFFPNLFQRLSIPKKA